MPAVLDEFLRVIGSLDFVEYGTLIFKRSEFQGDQLLIDLEVGIQDQVSQVWRLAFHGWRDVRVVDFGYISGFGVHAEHPLLLPYTDDTVNAYFRGEAIDLNAVFGVLVEQTQLLTDGWYSHTSFLNTGMDKSVTKHLAGGYGKLGSGPKSLFDAFARALDQHGISVSVTDCKRPRHWDGRTFVDETPPFVVAVWGNSYVIAKSLEVIKV